MAKFITANSFAEYMKAAESSKMSCSQIFALFTGSLTASGKSWCPDCVRADPVIEEAAKSLPVGTCLITTFIDRPTWKDPNNEFRKGNLKLKSIPTLVKLGSEERLVESECAKKSLVEMLLRK
eukprot:sb/3475902/